MEPTTIVLFGATGDLAKRKIYPALYNLFIDNKLPRSFSLIGLGRREWTDATFRANVEQSIRDFSRRQAKEPAALESFLQAFQYTVLNIGHQEDYRMLLQKIEAWEEGISTPANRLFYLSVGPEFFETIAANIESSGLGSTKGWKRLVIEKPFGHDLPTARSLNEKLSHAFTEDEILRIDHYLGKPMVQSLQALRQTNPVLQALWNPCYIANVQITANETVGVEERAGYYDQAGAIRDMFQNHLLQLLMMTAIGAPYNNDGGKVGDKKKLVMDALEPLDKQQAGTAVIRGQYTAGSIQGKPVVGYTSEPGIAPDSMNDTFIAAKLQINDSFWSGIPFYIRTGKRLKEKSTRIVVEFKQPSPITASPAGEKGAEANLFVVEMSPGESITLQLNTHDSRNEGNPQPVRVDLHPAKDNLPEAYENMIHDALNGDSTFFAHWDEVERSWAWVQPILEAFEENLVPLYPYESGTYGPAEADALLEKDGFHWWFDSKINQEKREDGNKQYAYNSNH